MKRPRNTTGPRLRMYFSFARKWGGHGDIVYHWDGDGTSKSDGALLNAYLSYQRLVRDFDNGCVKYDPSLLEELEARGYDLTTLRFSIRKNVPDAG